MAKKKAPKTAKKNIRDRAIDAALKLAASKGWAQVGMSDIAKVSKLKLPELFDHFEDKTDILVAFGHRIDRRVLENTGAGDDDLNPRDRLFDILMERFDVLNEYRDGVVAILDSCISDPKQAVIGLPHLCRSMCWMLEAAGLETSGVPGALRVAGLSALYLKALKAWKEDESSDMAKVMAVLDKDLSRAESLAMRFGF